MVSLLCEFSCDQGQVSKEDMTPGAQRMKVFSLLSDTSCEFLDRVSESMICDTENMKIISLRCEFSYAQ